MRFLDRIDRDAIADLLERDEYFWLDLDRSGEAEVDALGEVFAFHPLALEDMRKRGQRPKLDDFGDYMFLVYYGAAGARTGEIELEEVHAFLSGGYIVTSHARPLPGAGGSAPTARGASRRARSSSSSTACSTG